MQYKIGIGITAKNRHESTDLCLKHLKKHSKGIKIILVDDGSENPYPNSDYRFEKSVGIAKAKNKCLELLEDNDFIFLFDNDCWPTVDNWYLPYIEAYQKTGCNHLSFTFSHLSDGRPNGNKTSTEREDLISYHNACGCMIFLTKKCLEMAGGFDEQYGHYGYEHTDYSTRINNLGLTPYRFCDIPNSLRLFYSQDYYREVTTTLKAKQKRLSINAEVYKRNIKSKTFMPYKPLKTAVITTYFTNISDPQRNNNWEADIKHLDSLIKSMKGQKLIVLHDCFDTQNIENVEFIKVETTENPYFQRWISIHNYLSDKNYDYVFCVDANDVIMLNNPFSHELGDRLYVGDEKQLVSCRWIRENHNIKDEAYLNFINTHKSKQLINAGIIGGKQSIVSDFIKEIISYYYIQNKELGLTDMATFNFIAYTKFKHVLKHGGKINTEFKKNENTISATQRGIWWKHK